MFGKTDDNMEGKTMSGSSNSNSGTNQMAVPQAKEAMNRFKQEVASEIGVPLKDGYNGDLTSAQAGRHRRRDGQENDHEAGRADVRQINRLLLPIAPKTGLSL